MSKGLTLDLLQSQMKPSQRLTVSEETVAEIQKLADDPDYGEQFLDCYIDHLNIYKESPGRSHSQYLNAIKFFSLVEAGNSLTDAYIKLFPQRYEDRKHNHDWKDQKKNIMRGEASRFNSSALVNEIRKIASIPVQLIHRHILHEAILEQAELMRTARSEMVRQKAGACLIAELKPQEDHVIALKVEDGAISAISELHKAAEKLALAEHAQVTLGRPLKDIAESVILTVVKEEVNDEPES